MSKPESLKVEPWCSFGKQPYSIFTDDFSHDKLLVTKFTAQKDSTNVNLKQTLTNKSGKYSVSDEARLWFYIPNSKNSLYAKIRSNNYVKLQWDHGNTVIKGVNLNPYASINTNKSLDMAAVKLGVIHNSKHCHSDNRFKIVKEGSNLQ